MSSNPMSFPDVAETGMLTFYCHVIESQTTDPILRDEKAVEISHQLNPVFAKSSSRLLRNLARGKVKNELVVHITLRAKKHDEYARAFLTENPDGIIVNIGCGMDSRFHRVDNGQLTCFDLDLPEMIAFKKQFYTETDRYHFIAASVFDYAWMDQVAKMGKRPVLFMAEGVFMYLDGKRVQDLVLKLQSRFPGSELVCEVVTAFFTRKPYGLGLFWWMVEGDAGVGIKRPSIRVVTSCIWFPAPHPQSIWPFFAGNAYRI